ncbi:similar to Saccharomyces cerevisiae YNR040W Putative protein of unknown function [Maudiozyma barnettii]|uniref:Uncharacterized protein n=1 Tax=Maudiozyma barnettii TaxID=61262 RepID=A0A8H2ZI26_9SACH|nr:Mrx15p [Kazachstania barnettii]CAB4255428.1 similar to Saccharomyces cerevisiae YNR040W Putative protein of unknown function [Kazachstania barnettii]CAD1783859.1 similar to Saccharomyces cerevisiae YNR040W Putative protein of unknown function [Kazachstania barnettii]
MGGNVFRLLSELAARDVPQVIYSYKLRPLYRAGALSLSTVLVAYSLSFADVSKLSASLQYKNANGEEKKDALFLIKAYGPIGMALIPLTISIGSLFILSRTVTRVKYIPQMQQMPKCEITRTSAILGREITVTRPMKNIVRSSNVSIYTGKGPQGLDDKGSFSFYLKDLSPSLRTPVNSLYILPRSGAVWKSDGRILSALFGDSKKGKSILSDEGDDINSSVGNKSSKEEIINSTQKNIIIQEMMKLNANNKVKFHSKSKKEEKANLIKNIVNNTKSK